MKLRILSIVLLLTATLSSFAEEPVKFSASAQSTVILDKPFQLSYTLNAAGKDLKTPEFQFFDVLAGPFQSYSQSTQIINGRTSSSVTYTYTFTLLAQKTGTFTIPSASIMVDGKKYTSNGLTIKVLPADDNSAASSKNQNNQQNGGGSAVSGDKIFVKAIVSKSNVYEQEPVLVTYKLYTLVDVAGLNNIKLPDFNGFMKQDFKQDENSQLSYENFNGRNYGTIVLHQVLLYPQHAGEITIDRASFEAVIRIQNQRQARSIFDDFFGDSYTDITKNIIAPSTTIKVKALPADKPAGFSGVVGKLNMDAKISAVQVNANDAVTIKVTISGIGNLKLLKNPEFQFPDGFELYDPKVSNNFKTTTAGISGSKVIEYMFIPRHSGDFEIPSTSISYFDTGINQFRTLQTPAFKLNVQKGNGTEATVATGTFVNKEDVKLLGKDIRYIDTRNVSIGKEDEAYVGTYICWLLYLIPLFLGLGAFVLLRKQLRENSNITLLRNKKANRQAQKRLKLAAIFLNEGKRDLFHEEVMKAVWNYLSDKLSIPVANLTKENVISELDKLNIPSETTEQFINILNTCEFARFAPPGGEQEMGNLYNDTANAISELENTLKVRKK